MTGLEALNKFVNIFAEYCVKTQHQEMNATNMQTAVEYLARSNECRTIEKSLKALEIIKEKNVNMFGFKRDIKQLGNRFTYKYYQSNLGNYHSGFDIQELTEEEFELLRSVLE